MGTGSSARILLLAVIAVGSLALQGCPKQPEVAQAGPGDIGPAFSSQSGSAAPEAASPEQAQAETPATQSPATSAEVSNKSTPAGTPATTGPLVATAPFQRDVFFDYDQSRIREDQKAPLEANAVWLNGQPKAMVTIEGYCDERGTREYNLALGEQRADAVKDYLVAAGFPADRIATVSYGKDRPFVLGHDDGARSLNRRARIVVALEESS